MRQLKILHAVEILQGGTSSYLEELIPAQIAHYGRDHVLLLAPDEQEKFESFAGWNFAPFKRERKHRWLSIIRLVIQFRKLVGSFQPDVVHAHSSFAGLAIRLGAFGLRRRPKIVYCAHGWAFDRQASSPTSNAVAASVERLLARVTDTIVCISRHDLDSAIARGLPQRKLVLIRNAIGWKPLSTSPGVNWPADRFRFLFVGRFDKQKGVDIFVKALGSLGDTAFGYMIGDAAVNEEVPFDLPSNVQRLGWLARSQVEAYMSTADALVVPSRWEGFGIVAVEAMRVGLPVIAARVGGLAEIVSDGETGLLCEPGSVTAFTDAMRKMVAINSQEMRGKARKRFEDHFQSDDLNKEIIALYERLSA
jgi:glycosyltransferase involved in cell wall biosynthesis